MDNDEQITALAREYAEEKAKGTAADALPDGFKQNVIQRNADHFEKHLRWLLRRYYLVQKQAAIKEYREQTFRQDPDRDLASIVVNQVLDRLFPELGKEVES